MSKIPRLLAVILVVACLVRVGVVIFVSALYVAETEPRPADTAGSAPIGTAVYPVPANGIFVSTTGSDSGRGTQADPVRTLKRALALVPAAGTIVLRGGTYNETVEVYTSVTIQNYPGEEVWLDGSRTVTGWVKNGTRWRYSGWTTRFDHSPTYTRGAPEDDREGWRFVDPVAAPMAAHPDQVFINGVAQQQVKSLSAVVGPTFYLDESTSTLYLGSSPVGQRVDVSNLQYAINVRAASVTLRGFGIRRFAPSVWQMGAVTLERPEATVENVVIRDVATTGVSVLASDAMLHQVTVERAGMLGIHGHHADNSLFSSVRAAANNTERFNMAPVSGGAKVTVSRGVTLANSTFTGNRGPGFWEDMSVYDTLVRGSNFTNNLDSGLFLEISAKAVVGDSLFSGNATEGIKVNNTSNVKIWNNTFVGNGRPLNLVQDPRRNTNRNDPAADPRQPFPDPEMPWQLEDVQVSNNVVALSTERANCLLCVEDYSHLETAAAMRITVNGNLYHRATAQAPTWLVVWSRGAGDPSVFTSLAAFRSATGQESRGQETVGGTAVDSSGVLSAATVAKTSAIALPLPDDLAHQIVRPGGTKKLGAWLGHDEGVEPENPVCSAAEPPDQGPLEATPTASGSAPPTATSSGQPTSGASSLSNGTVLARDMFSRVSTNGWGTAELGGPWSHPAAPAKFATADGLAVMRLEAGDGFSARLDDLSTSTADLRVAQSFDVAPGASGYFLQVLGRTTVRGDYRLKINIAPGAASTGLWLVRVIDGQETVLSSTALTDVAFGPGDRINIRLQTTGTDLTAIKASVWKGSSAEPSRWSLTATDCAAGLQTPGGVGLYAYSPGGLNGGPTTIYTAALTVTG